MKTQLCLNYQTLSTGIQAQDLPTLISENQLKALTRNDPDPYYKSESIAYPAQGTGGIYTESFFESFLNVTKERPIPGSKRGHTFDSRPESDLYTVGGRLDSAGNGSGVLHLKIYVPKQGDQSSNEALIRDMEAGIVHFSLVTLAETNSALDEAGKKVTYITKSAGYERNDAVEYGAGAMQQTVNSAQDWPQLQELVLQGNIDFDTKTGALALHGKVCYSGIRARIAAGDKTPELTNLLSMIDKRRNQKESKKMTTDEVLAHIVANRAEFPLGKIAKLTDQEDLLKSQAEIDGLKADCAKLQAALDGVADLQRKNKLDAEYGKEGDLRAYAQVVLGNAALDVLDEKIEALKKDPIALKLAGNAADPYKQGIKENQGDQPETKTFGGLTVREI